MEPKYNTVQEVVGDQLCCCCGTCAAVCPAKAIQMTETPAGLLVPTVDTDKCNECGLCLKVCPGIGLDKGIIPDVEDVFEGHIESCYCGYACDEDVRGKAQSGGLVTALLLNLLETKQIDKVIVTIMPEDGTFRPKAVLTDRPQDIIAACGSKYCPVSINELLTEVKSGEKVAMVGLPCHFQGLAKIQKHKDNFNNILKIGLVCEHILSFNAIDFFLHKSNTSQSAVKLRYKDKKYGGWPGNITIKNDSGATISLNSSYRFNAKKFFKPYRCFLCFDKLNILSDIVIGDAWGVPGQKGNNILISRNCQANKILVNAEKSSSFQLEKKTLKDSLGGQKISDRKQSYLANMEFAGDMNMPCPEPIVIEKSVALRANKKNLLYSYKIGQETEKKRIINSAKRRVYFARIARKYSLTNITRKLLAVWRKK